MSLIGPMTPYLLLSVGVVLFGVCALILVDRAVGKMFDEAERQGKGER